MNIVTLTIISCNNCPHINSDINRTRKYCEYWRDMGISYESRLLYWFGSDEECGDIPDWCPLLDKEEK